MPMLSTDGASFPSAVRRSGSRRRRRARPAASTLARATARVRLTACIPHWSMVVRVVIGMSGRRADRAVRSVERSRDRVGRVRGSGLGGAGGAGRGAVRWAERIGRWWIRSGSGGVRRAMVEARTISVVGSTCGAIGQRTCRRSAPAASVPPPRPSRASAGAPWSAADRCARPTGCRRSRPRATSCGTRRPASRQRLQRAGRGQVVVGEHGVELDARRPAACLTAARPPSKVKSPSTHESRVQRHARRRRRPRAKPASRSWVQPKRFGAGDHQRAGGGRARAGGGPPAAPPARLVVATDGKRGW